METKRNNRADLFFNRFASTRERSRGFQLGVVVVVALVTLMAVCCLLILLNHYPHH